MSCSCGGRCAVPRAAVEARLRSGVAVASRGLVAPKPWKPPRPALSTGVVPDPIAGPAKQTAGRSSSPVRPDWGVKVRPHPAPNRFGRCLTFHGVAGPWVLQDITIEWRGWALDCDRPPPYLCRSRVIELFRVVDHSGKPVSRGTIGETAVEGLGLDLQSDPSEAQTDPATGRLILKGDSRYSVGPDGLIGVPGLAGVRSGVFDCHDLPLAVGDGCDATCRLEGRYEATLYDGVSPPAQVRVNDKVGFMLLFKEVAGSPCMCPHYVYTAPPSYAPAKWAWTGTRLSYWYEVSWDACPCGSKRPPTTAGPPGDLPPEDPPPPDGTAPVRPLHETTQPGWARVREYLDERVFPMPAGPPIRRPMSVPPMAALPSGRLDVAGLACSGLHRSPAHGRDVCALARVSAWRADR